jgi:hexosaminidase
MSKTVPIFPVPTKAEYPGDLFPVKNLTVSFECQDDLFAANYLADKLSKEFHIPKNVKKCATAFCGTPVYIKRHAAACAINTGEAYTLTVEKDRIEICGSGYRCVLYGVYSLIQLFRKTSSGVAVEAARVEDSPYKEFRGVHVYTPARRDIGDFKRMIDMLANLKINTMILETGAGMELEHHPEINEVWEKTCRDTESFPGGPRALQASEVYWKDRIHTEIGGGSFISKTEMKDICDYAAIRGIEVIPEIQGLCHCYYLTVAHREIAERPNEPYPDSWCPSKISSATS